MMYLLNVSAEKSQLYDKLIEKYEDVYEEAYYTQTYEDEYWVWDGYLNEIWGELKAVLSDSEMEALRDKQRVWIKEKENLYGDGNNGYTDYQAVSAMTNERVIYLIEVLNV